MAVNRKTPATVAFLSSLTLLLYFLTANFGSDGVIYSFLEGALIFTATSLFGYILGLALSNDTLAARD